MKGWRTVTFNIVAMIGMLVTVLTGTETKDDVVVVQESTMQAIEAGIVVWGIVSVWLRAITNTPIFWGKDASFRPTNHRR